jgi:trafficking protein particle complex subunit 11
LTADRSDGTPAPLVLHSPLSPLTPSSPLYPDGISTPQWITKHQAQLPSALLVFFKLTTDSNTSSLLDNKIKTEISNLKSVLASTNYKTRLVTVLLAGGHIDELELGDRLTNIRRATGIDKNLHFIPSDVSQTHITDFVQSLLSSFYQQCIEYYRDLSKHARRKRNRNTIPSPTIPPTDARPLPAQGWVARYEFKLGVFAEFRQEMDAACRNYEAAYESLLAPEMIDMINVRTPRFNEARLLSDVIAIRILRCLLWNGQTTTAVRTWTSHRDRTKDLVNRRGRGTDNYGWEAWQSIWTKTMADLLSRSEQFALAVKSPGTGDILSVLAGPEKSLSVGERMTPWENLAHEGYWLHAAQKHVQRRKELALEMSDEERQRSTEGYEYETYLTLPPNEESPADGEAGYDHIGELISLLEKADSYFDERGQVFMREIVGLKIAQQHLRRRAWTEAAEILKPLWKDQVWRQAGWWKLLQHVGWALLDCASQLKDSEAILPLKFELFSSVFSQSDAADKSMYLDLPDPPHDVKHLDFAIDVREVATPITSSFAFASADGHVGEPLNCQFTLESTARPGTEVMKLTGVKIAFDGSLKTIYIHALKGAASTAEIEATTITLQETSRSAELGDKHSSVGGFASVAGEGNLNFRPGQTRIFSLQVIPREAGEVSVASITLFMEIDAFNLTINNSDIDSNRNCWWETKNSVPVRREIGPSRDVSKIQVLPKPPKVEIQARNFNQAYYTNERIELALEILNNEEEAVVAAVEAHLISPIKGSARIGWANELAVEADSESLSQSLPSKNLSTIEPDASKTVTISISDTTTAVDHELEITVTYKISSDEESVLRKTLTLDIAVVRPFEANYDFTPKFDPEPWPSFFSPPTPATPTRPAPPQGLTQHFLVTANLVSFATTPLTIEGILLTSTKVTGGATASSTTGILKHPSSPAEKISAPISPEQTLPFNFSLAVQKLILGDRHTVSLDLALEIAWRRDAEEKVHTTTLEVPRFVVPMAEPRVLVTARKVTWQASKPSGVDAGGSAFGRPDVYVLTYTIENPSMHFLTFNIGMESSEEFAFSGMKSGSVSVVPCSRVEIKYKILPSKRDGGTEREKRAKKDGREEGEWIRVQLNVVDAWFNQVLRVQPAVGMGEGVVGAEGGEERVKVDRKGGVVVRVD